MSGHFIFGKIDFLFNFAQFLEIEAHIVILQVRLDSFEGRTCSSRIVKVEEFSKIDRTIFVAIMLSQDLLNVIIILLAGRFGRTMDELRNRAVIHEATFLILIHVVPFCQDFLESGDQFTLDRVDKWCLSDILDN